MILARSAGSSTPAPSSLAAGTAATKADRSLSVAACAGDAAFEVQRASAAAAELGSSVVELGRQVGASATWRR